jgi:hypothetical protein
MIIMTRDGEPVGLATGDNSTLLVGGELAISFCTQGSKLGKKRKEKKRIEKKQANSPRRYY